MGDKMLEKATWSRLQFFSVSLSPSFSLNWDLSIGSFHVSYDDSHSSDKMLPNSTTSFDVTLSFLLSTSVYFTQFETEWWISKRIYWYEKSLFNKPWISIRSKQNAEWPIPSSVIHLIFQFKLNSRAHKQNQKLLYFSCALNKFRKSSQFSWINKDIIHKKIRLKNV